MDPNAKACKAVGIDPFLRWQILNPEGEPTWQTIDELTPGVPPARWGDGIHEILGPPRGADYHDGREGMRQALAEKLAGPYAKHWRGCREVEAHHYPDLLTPDGAEMLRRALKKKGLRPVEVPSEDGDWVCIIGETDILYEDRFGFGDKDDPDIPEEIIASLGPDVVGGVWGRGETWQEARRAAAEKLGGEDGDYGPEEN